MKTEPVLTAAVVAGAIVSLLSVFNIGLDLGVVETIVAAILPIVTATLAREKVRPVK
jgi:hypothetical protein